MLPYLVQEGKYEKIMETSGSFDQVRRMHLFQDEQGLVDYLFGKVVGDLGSGAGIFALEAYTIAYSQEIPTTIYSINPRYNYASIEGSVQDFHMSEEVFFFETSERIFRLKAALQRNEVSFDDFKTRILAKFNSTKDDSSWESLKFPDNFFDTLFATKSYIFYPSTFSESSIVEIMRVIRPGGVLKTTNPFTKRSVILFENWDLMHK